MQAGPAKTRQFVDSRQFLRRETLGVSLGDDSVAQQDREHLGQAKIPKGDFAVHGSTALPQPLL
ncbi:MAG TPA: hypothetical protein VN515_07225 [Terriglobales bacterium]|nr:hypothetical protein [Terriglobales bacterium]